MKRLSVLLAAASALITFGAGPVYAHAERSAETPEENSRVDQPPAEIVVDFTEPPTGDASASVTDGCGNELVSAVSASNQTLTLSLASGQPGKWQVTTQVVSAVDGHPTSDSWSFRVAGRADCEAPAPDTSTGDRAAPDTNEDESGSSLPWLAIGAGALALVGVAVLLRGRA